MVDDTVSPASRAKSKSVSELPFTFPKFLGKFAFPTEFGDLAEKSSLQAKENYEQLRYATEDLTGGFKGAYESAAKGTLDYGVRLIETGRTNLNAAFEYATDLLSAKSPAEVIELSTERLHKQLETLSEQSSELASLAQKIATESAGPLRESFSKAFTRAA